MVSSALATQRCFWPELRHRSTLAVYAPSCALSDSRQLVVVASPSHPLKQSKKIPAERLGKEVFIAREVGSGTRINADEFFRHQGAQLSVGMELGDNSAVKEAVAAGLGIALLSRHTIRMELALRRLVVLDVKGLPLRRQWYVVHRQDKRLSRAAVAFKAFLLTSAEAVLESIKPLSQEKEVGAAESRRLTKRRHSL